MAVNDQLTIFHVTHWKSGSQWIYAVLRECAEKRVIPARKAVAHFYEDALQPGMIYPTVYATRPKFYNTLLPNLDDPIAGGLAPSSTAPADVQNWYNFVQCRLPYKAFFVFRDLRDTLVSLYFSMKVSHPVISKHIAEMREKLNEAETDEEGMLSLFDKELKGCANIQRSWINSKEKNDNILFVRYEDLIANEQSEFAKIIDYCGIDVSPAKMRVAVQNNSFSKRAGRNPGENDNSSHHRKGISGDWKNYFTDRIKVEFKEKFGQVLIDTGYEQDMNW